MGVDTSAVDQFRQVLREMARPGEGGAALAEILQQGSREGTRVVALEDGTGNALAARVNPDNNLGTEARYGRTSVVTGSVTVDNSSAICVTQEPGMVNFELQNQDDTYAIYFHIGPGAATTSDLRLDPGQRYSLPPGVSSEGPVSCITAAGTALLSFVKFISAP